MTRLIAVLTGLMGLMFAFSAVAGDAANVTTAKGKFADVRDDLVAAIEQRGLVVNFTAHVGDMLERTGRDLGKTKRIYEQADVIEFCSATASRAMMEADPVNLVYCPYTVAVYTLPGKPGVVYLAYRKYPRTAALKPVDKLLAGIIADASK
jgi:uncharacterized protein (DUF302 family)